MLSCYAMCIVVECIELNILFVVGYRIFNRLNVRLKTIYHYKNKILLYRTNKTKNDIVHIIREYIDDINELIYSTIYYTRTERDTHTNETPCISRHSIIAFNCIEICVWGLFAIIIIIIIIHISI